MASMISRLMSSGGQPLPGHPELADAAGLGTDVVLVQGGDDGGGGAERAHLQLGEDELAAMCPVLDGGIDGQGGKRAGAGGQGRGERWTAVAGEDVRGSAPSGRMAAVTPPVTGTR